MAHSNLGDEYKSSNALPSTGATNFWTGFDTADMPSDMDDQPGPQDDPANVQGDGGQFWDPESIVETGQEPNREGPPLFVFFILLFLVLFFFVLLPLVVAIAVAGAGRLDLR